jgi:hypothetical protein
VSPVVSGPAGAGVRQKCLGKKNHTFLMHVLNMIYIKNAGISKRSRDHEQFLM